MALPRILKHFNVFADGISHAGEVEEITLPKLTRKLEEYRAGGMNGPIDIDLGNEKLELETTYGGLMRDILKQYGTTTVDGAMVRFAGAYQAEDTAGVDAVEITVRGRHTEVDFGNAKAGGKEPFKVKSSLVLQAHRQRRRVDRDRPRQLHRARVRRRPPGRAA